MKADFQDPGPNPAQSFADVERANLAAAVEQAADGIVVTDIHGTIRYVNPSFTEMTGYTIEEAVGRNPRILKSGCHSAAFYKEMWSTIRSGRVWRGELTNRRKDGTTYQEESRISPAHGENGKVVGYVAIKRDITERRRAEAALRESEARFRSMADSSPSMMWVTNEEGGIQFVNRMYREFSGITCEEAQADKWRTLLHADDASQYLAAFDKAIKERSSFSAEARMRRPNGEWRLVGSRGEPRFSLNGKYLGHIGLQADITARRKAEQLQEFQNSLIRTIYEGSLDGILVVNPDGIVVSHNKRLLDVWRIPLTEISDGQARDFVGAHHKPFFHAILERVKDRETYRRRVQALENNPEATDRGEIELKDGRTLERYYVSLRSESGQYLGHARFFRDITEQKQAERALKESEERFRIMADGCPMPMWVTGADAGIQFVNRALREFAGEEQVEDDNWLLFSHPDDAQAFFEESRRVVRERVPLRTEARFRRADGEWRWLAVVGEPRFSSSGEFLGHIGLGMDITERKQAEQALKETEERFRVMADSCPLGIWVTDGQGRTLFANRAYRKFCGIASEEVEPDAWLFLLHPDDAAGFMESFDRAIQGHKSFSGEQRVRRADGEWRWLESTAVPRFSPGGEFLGLVGTSQDITGRKQAEQALQSSEEQFRQLAENIRQVFWLKDPGTDGFLYVSPAFEQVWERSCDSIYKDPNSRLAAIHPDDLASSRTAFARQMQGEEVESEYRIRTPDGREKWIRGRTFPIRDRGGKLIRIAGIAEDITERKLHEEELIRARANAEAANLQLAAQHAALDNERNLLRTFIDNIPDWIFVKDTDSNFIVVNREFARCAGVEKPEDLIGKSDRDLFPAEVAERIYEDDRAVIRSGRPMFNREETVEKSANKMSRILLTTKVPLLDSQGHVTGIAGMARDITKRKAMEDELREGNRELQRSIDRANQLALDAQAANRSKSEFLANMSHEIRTPMNGVIGMNGLLLSTNMDAEQRHYAEVIDTCARSLLTVIDDILDFSKVEAGKLEIDAINFNLHVLMGDFAGMMAERVGDKPLEFVCAVAPDVKADLRGDPGRLRQVLQNLVSNAMKFTHQGEVVVRVELISETDGDVELRFAVRDTGIGIPRDKQQILFTSFTQVDASTTRQYGGTGLGLAISKKLVGLMGGEIGFESKEGEGSTFWFTIRLAKQSPDRQANVHKVPVKGARVLVVDDNATNREVLTAQLQSWGAAVVAVESGATALACLRYAATTGSPFQVAVLDMMMPGMDGATLGRAILAEGALKAIPLVMMTSLGQRGDALCFKEIGFAAYLIKPVRPSDLFDCLVNLLAGDRKAEPRSLITRHSLQAARRSSARILLVEDNVTNQEVACGMLERMGWHADLARDGSEAVHALETRAYDLVMMDVQMPVMDGYEATRRIRDPESMVLNHDIPIIATTAHAMAGDAEKCLNAGMSDYISKPIDPKILESHLEKWLTRKQHQPPVASPAASARDSHAQIPATPSAALVFNREKFLERMMGDEEFAREVAAEFLKELPALVSILKQHVAQLDLEAIWKQAHKIKGSAANVGGEALRDVALKVEQAGKAGNSEDVVHWAPELEVHAAQLIDAMQSWQAELASSKH